MEELAKRRGRPPKPRPSILSPEQVLALRGNTPQTVESPEQANARRAKDAARKRVERDHARVEKEMAEVEDIQSYWAKSRALADPAQMQPRLVRQEEIFDTMHWMEAVMSGTYDVDPSETEYYVGIEEGDEDIKRQLREFGMVHATPILLIGKFWQEPELLAQLASGDTPSAIFAKFGILTALPDLRVHQWGEFMARHRAATGKCLYDASMQEIELRPNQLSGYPCRTSAK